ncbi:hypothetical protein HMPREF0083_02606 [Aneurinibacillus aneurinilyticus ATCC 12856]|uniref:Uncharacterized protein n=1 Tax=Aneurinibacillus aneurinilyticus ATCC 12856 TaxID=649747 RepID=U1YB51_ANEAE|nr:hypothetical protein HMPREF0083_02606 [Aneurinibacillus aneurinilyticus ATCC 12856]
MSSRLFLSFSLFFILSILQARTLFSQGKAGRGHKDYKKN